ncbi:MAG TPA: hypothetical protein VGL35_08320 [Rhizomicrobium sp.]|jgi:tetratricopeptide (TPR) repeat protein
MVEERDREPATSAPGVDWALSAAGRETAENYLKEQTRLARLQADELLREDRLRRWSHRVHHVSDVMKVTFEVSAALIALIVIVIVGATIWSAAHDNGAVIESFKVPPDMVQKGLSGDVVASELLDRLAYMEAHTESARAPGTYASNFGKDIRVDIPDTGISIGEAYRYLTGWLGHQTQISGEIFRTAGGIALTTRSSGHPGARFTGSEQTLDKLVERAAEYIYGETQPFRYGVYLMQQNRRAEADTVLGDLARNGPPSERPWAYADWMYIALGRGDLADTLARGREAARLGPQNALAQINAASAEAMAGHDEQVLRYSAATQAASVGEGRHEVAAYAASAMTDEATVAIAEEQGDFAAALAGYDGLLREPEFTGSHWSANYMKGVDAAKMHDIAAAHRYLGSRTDALMIHLASVGVGWNLIDLDFPQYQLHAALGDWRAARADLKDALATPDAKKLPFWQPLIRTGIWPWLALAEAKAGDIEAARRQIGKTPSDCYLCVRMRGNIEDAANKPAGAAYWFARAVAQAPSVPFAWTDWGAMLLRRGDYNGAIAKVATAHAKGPHFADPLEMWGEALMQKNRSDLALAKFGEANKYAPNWGRLHLEWGKALLYAGRKDEAQQQLATASHLELNTSDAAALARLNGVHG